MRGEPRPATQVKPGLRRSASSPQPAGRCSARPGTDTPLHTGEGEQMHSVPHPVECAFQQAEKKAETSQQSRRLIRGRGALKKDKTGQGRSPSRATSTNDHEPGA